MGPESSPSSVLPAVLRGRDPYRILDLAPRATREELGARVRALGERLGGLAGAEGEDGPDDAEGAAMDAAGAFLEDRAQRKAYDTQDLLAWKKPSAPSTEWGAGGRKPSCGVGMPWWSKLVALAGGPIAPDATPQGVDAYQLHLTAGLTCAAFADGSMLDEAAREFRRALLSDPTGWHAAYNLGLVLYRQGRFDEALGCFASLAARSPQEDPSHRMVDCLQPWRLPG